jgi:hypothetical protein
LPEAQDHDDASIAADFHQMTENGVSGRRRDVLKRLAQKYRVSTNAVYRAVESHKKSVK